MKKSNGIVFLASIILLSLSTVLYANYFTNLLLTSAVVHVKLKQDGGKYVMAGCSGTYISDYLVLTAAHCFESTDYRVWIKDYNATSFECKVLKIDTAKDLALLGVVHIKDVKHTHTTIGPEGTLGQHVFIVGSPFGLNFLLSEGIISKLNTTLKPFTGSYTIHTGMINSGSSGGGLFDTQGRLIGVNTLTIGGPFGWAGISCAVDSNTIKEFLK